jgi:hypothetical protein
MPSENMSLLPFSKNAIQNEAKNTDRIGEKRRLTKKTDISEIEFAIKWFRYWKRRILIYWFLSNTP